MERIWLSEGIKIRYKKFIEPKLSDEQKELIKQLAEDIKKHLIPIKK